MGDDRLLVVSREIKKSGRSRCRMNGQTVTVLTLNEVGRLLMDIHGQHEHQSLFSAVSQREILDRFGGEQIKRGSGPGGRVIYQMARDQEGTG